MFTVAEREEINKHLDYLCEMIAQNNFVNATIALSTLFAALKMETWQADPAAIISFLQTNKIQIGKFATPGMAPFLAFIKEVVADENAYMLSCINRGFRIQDLGVRFYFAQNLLIGATQIEALFSLHSVQRIPEEEKKNIHNFLANLEQLTNISRHSVSDVSFYKNPPRTWNSLFIESFDEIFTDIPDKNYVKFILINIEKRLAICAQKGLPVYILHYEKNVEQLYQNIEKYLGQNSLVKKVLEQQRIEGITQEHFVIKCELLAAKTLLLGGISRFACIQHTARESGKNIFVKGKWALDEPNLRRVMPDRKYLHENVIIDPEITEGFNPFDPDQSVTDAQYIKYPAFACVPDVAWSPFLIKEAAQVSQLQKLFPIEQADIIRDACSPATPTPAPTTAPALTPTPAPAPAPTLTRTTIPTGLSTRERGFYGTRRSVTREKGKEVEHPHAQPTIRKGTLTRNEFITLSPLAFFASVKDQPELLDTIPFGAKLI